jgi:hypothetical protein
MQDQRTATLIVTCPDCGEMTAETRPSNQDIIVESRNVCHGCRSARMVVIPGRTWRHVAEIIGGDQTARWSQHIPSGVWYVSAGWKRPNKLRRLSADQAAYVSSLIGEA